MPKKKIKDFTIGEIREICSKKNCMDCLFAQFVTMGEECPITNIRKEDLDKKVEVD